MYYNYISYVIISLMCHSFPLFTHFLTTILNDQASCLKKKTSNFCPLLIQIYQNKSVNCNTQSVFISCPGGCILLCIYILVWWIKLKLNGVLCGVQNGGENCFLKQYRIEIVWKRLELFKFRVPLWRHVRFQSKSTNARQRVFSASY